MRKITKQIAEAFYAERELKINNTYTDGQAVWLHGNKIIERRRDGIWFTLAGWNTNTTRERLNGILRHVRIHIHRVKGNAIAIADGASKEVDDHEWVNVNDIKRGY